MMWRDPLVVAVTPMDDTRATVARPLWASEDGIVLLICMTICSVVECF